MAKQNKSLDVAVDKSDVFRRVLAGPENSLPRDKYFHFDTLIKKIQID